MCKSIIYKYGFLILCCLIFANILSCSRKISKAMVWKYPSFNLTPVVDKYFEKEITDEYRAIENTDNSDIKTWFAEENKFYDNVINRIANKDSLIEEIKTFQFSSSYRASIPRVSANKIFFKRFNVREKSTGVFCRDLEGKNEVELFNTSSLGRSGEVTYTISFCEPSFDGSFLAMGVAIDGSEMSRLYVLDVKNKTILKDSIERCMYGYPNWHPDGSGFFYNQLKELGNGSKIGMYENSYIKFHIIGTAAETDATVFSQSINKNLQLADPSSTASLAIA